MTLISPLVGTRIYKPVKLSTTNATTIAAAAEKQTMTVDSVRLSAGAGGSTISLWVTDGTNIYYLIEGYTLAANTVLQIEGHHVPMRDGWSLKAQAGTANVIFISTVLIQSNPTQPFSGSVMGVA